MREARTMAQTNSLSPYDTFAPATNDWMKTITQIPRFLVLLSVWSFTMARCVHAFSFKTVVSKGFRATTTSRPSIAFSLQSYSRTCQQPHWKTQSCLLSSVSDDSAASGKKRICFLGTPEVAATSLKAIYEASLEPDSLYEIVSVVTQPPKRRKRKGKPEPSPVGKLSEELGIPVLCPEKAKDVDFLDELEKLQPDLCITAAYGQYLPKRFLAAPELGTVNIHPSLLPRWRGASPVQRSLEAGDNPVGVSVLYTVSKMDAGPLIAQTEQTIDENDTSATTLPLLFDIGTQSLLDVLPDICSGKITFDTAEPQNDEAAVSAAMISTAEAEFKVWEESATACHNRLRGFSMWPQAFMYFKVGDRDPMKVKIIETRVVKDETAEPTDLVEAGPTKKSGLYVVCGDGSILELLFVQPATRKAFRARDFQNGYPGEAIRWCRTPEDQVTDPEKYNSRAAKV